MTEQIAIAMLSMLETALDMDLEIMGDGEGFWIEIEDEILSSPHDIGAYIAVKAGWDE